MLVFLGEAKISFEYGKWVPPDFLMTLANLAMYVFLVFQWDATEFI